MKHIKKRVCKIIDELITYFFVIGATNIDINLQEKEDHYKILLRGNYTTKDKSKIEKLVKYLKCDKQEEMEEYYWELAGESDVDTELTLVGMMTDNAEINISEDMIEVVLYRYKQLKVDNLKEHLNVGMGIFKGILALSNPRAIIELGWVSH